MIKKFKKGFTIVELVIVIAVISVLTAVLIPTFSSLVSRANLSADIATVKNVNTILASDEAVNGKNTRFADALDVIKQDGYILENMTFKSGTLVWDSVANRFAIIDAKGKNVIEDVKLSKNNNDIWTIVDAMPSVQKYNVYLSEKFDDESVQASKSIDVGQNQDVNVTYVNDGAAQSVDLYTNGGNLSINAPADNVYHYGQADSVVIKAVANESYHLYGKVKGNVEIQKGRVSVHQNAEIATILITATDANNVKILIDSSAEVKTVAATTQNIINSTNVIVPAQTKVETEVVDMTKVEKFAGGIGTQESPYLISNLKELKNIATVVSQETQYQEAGEKTYFALANDITTDINFNSTVKALNDVVLDGAGYTITLYQDTTFVDRLNNSEIKNLTFYAQSSQNNTKAMVAQYAINVVLENVTTTGKIHVKNNGAAFFNYTQRNITLKNCENQADIIGTGENTSYNAVFIAYPYKETLSVINIENCVNSGSLVCGQASIFLSNLSQAKGGVVLNIKNFKNTGYVKSMVMGFVPNQYYSRIGSNCTITINVDGVQVEKTYICAGNFYSANDVDSMNITVNDNKTITFQKSTLSDVAYYIVSFGYYGSKTGTGTNYFTIQERIEQADTNVTGYTTTLKYLSVTENRNGKFISNGTVAGYNVVLNSDTNTQYYLHAHDVYSIGSGIRKCGPITVSVYNAQGELLSAKSIEA